MKRLVHLAVALATLFGGASCSTSTSPRSGSAPAAAPSGATPTPTPGILSRLDPGSVVEETETYVIHRLRKKDYIRVDDRHIRHPLISGPVEFFKEDEDYYYISTPRWTPEELAQRQMATGSATAPTPTPRPPPRETRPKPSLSEFEDVVPSRSRTRLNLQKVASSGLPDAGMWRASFELADVNRDGKIDVVSPAPRVGDANLHIFLGDGRGGFSEWPLTFTEDGAPSTNFAIGYGGVAVGDIDGDGKIDVVTASHNGGIQSLFGNGAGEFRVVQKGLPGKDFSSQAIALLDVDGDGKLDIVASRDVMIQDSTTPGPSVRIYLYRGSKGWQIKEDAIVRGVISNSLNAWDFDGDGRKDVLTGSHQFAAVPLLWRNEGNGTFSAVKSDEFEVWAFHFATAPGTFGARRVPAFADAFHLYTDEPKVSRAIGINVYSFEGGAWKRHRVWRHKEGKSAQYALALGDLDGDGLDDVAFADSEERRLRIFFQRSDGSFEEMAMKDEPALDSPGQCIRFGDLDGDGRLDLVVAKTVSSTAPGDRGGWDVYLNRR